MDRIVSPVHCSEFDVEIKDICIFHGRSTHSTTAYLINDRQTSAEGGTWRRILTSISSMTSKTNQESAIHRTPVEIWRQILQMAVEWLDIPHPQDDNLKNLSFKWKGCERYHDFTISISTRANIRLVCHSWNEEMGVLGDDMVITDLRTGFWSKKGNSTPDAPFKDVLENVACIHVVGPGVYCRCDRVAPSLTSSGSYTSHLPPPLRWKTGRDGISLSDVAIGSKIILSEDSNNGVTMVDQARKVQILSLHVSDFGKASMLLGRLAHLTHLKLKLNDYQPDQNGHPPTLPSLVCLHLLFDPRVYSQFQYRGTFSTWSCPRLRLVQISGKVEKITKKEIEKFTRVHQGTITGLILEFDWFDSQRRHISIRTREDREFWNLFTRLSLFGASLKWFVNTESLPTELPSFHERSEPITAFVYDFELDTSLDISDLERLASNLTTWCSSISVTRIAMQRSWKELIRSLALSHGKRLKRKGGARYDGFQSSRTFFNVVFESGISFCDIDGVELGSASTRSLLSAIAAY